jgi:hypothetical protein
MSGGDITHADALLWLNDKLGRTVNLDVGVDCGGRWAHVIGVHGTLQHWRATPVARVVEGLIELGGAEPELLETREDIVGM